jgi:hypothetical protein
MMFLDCPAYLEQDRALRCGLPAEVTGRFTMRSTDGPLESASIRCPADHHLTGAIESLTWDGTDRPDPGPARAGSRTGRNSHQHGHDPRHGGGGPAPRNFPAEPPRKARRPNGAPAYYQGRPAARWITAMSPRGRPTASRYPTQAAALTAPR